MKNYYSRSSLASKKVIPQNMLLLIWLTKFMNHLKTAITRMLGVFIDLFKAFCTVDHAISSKKLENDEIRGTNLAWFRSYLRNRKEYIQMTNDSKINLRNTTCGVPQVSILGLLLFSAYVNDLPSYSKISNPIMFVHDKNLFYEHIK